MKAGLSTVFALTLRQIFCGKPYAARFVASKERFRPLRRRFSICRSTVFDGSPFKGAFCRLHVAGEGRGKGRTRNRAKGRGRQGDGAKGGTVRWQRLNAGRNKRRNKIGAGAAASFSAAHLCRGNDTAGRRTSAAGTTRRERRTFPAGTTRRERCAFPAGTTRREQRASAAGTIRQERQKFPRRFLILPFDIFVSS